MKLLRSARVCGIFQTKRFVSSAPSIVHMTMQAPNPPGPRGLPVVGQMFTFPLDRAHLKFMEWQKQYGDIFIFQIGGKSMLVLNHPDLVRKAFTDSEYVETMNDRTGGFMGVHVIDNYKDIVFRDYDSQQRTIKYITTQFVENVALQNEQFMSKVSSEMANVVKTLRDQKQKALDLPELLDTSASRIIGLLLSGRLLEDESPAFRCLRGFEKHGNQLGRVKNQLKLSVCPCMRNMPGKLGRTYAQLVAEKQNLRRYLVEEIKPGDIGLVATLKKHSEMKKSTKDDWLDDEFIMGVIMDLTAAAIVPLQNTLTVLFLQLVHQPEVQEMIRAEIDSVVGGGRQPKLSDMQHMPYTTACIKELHRFHTPLPVSARHCNKSTDVVLNGYKIPQGTEIFTNLFGINHDERFYEDPWNFLPERFLGGDGKLLPDGSSVNRHLISNGVGPRSCVGSTFAFNNLFLYVTNILQNSHLLPAEGHPLPTSDPRQLLPGVVTRAPPFKCKAVDLENINAHI